MSIRDILPNNPQYPIYIVSKGRHESRLTSRTLETMGVPYKIIVEENELELYSSVIDRKKILILDKEYQKSYDTCDNLRDIKGTGPGPARNFAWDHSISEGYLWHWVMDDNIRSFHRWNNNLKVPVSDGTIFRCMEDFSNRYANVLMSGPNYFMFASRKTVSPPFIINTRIYSCNLIRNNTPFRWRGRYNEDTDLSIRILKSGYCTVQFNAFLQYKITTQKMRGGNMDEFYKKEGTKAKSEMLWRLHPDVTKLVYKFGRHHHYINYKIFNTKLIRREGIHIEEGTDNYGMRLEKIA